MTDIIPAFPEWVCLWFLLIGQAIALLGAWQMGIASESASKVIQGTKAAAAVLIAVGLVLVLLAFVLKVSL